MKQDLIISWTLKALDFLLKKSVLTTIVFYTKKDPRGRAFIGLTNLSPEAICKSMSVSLYNIL